MWYLCFSVLCHSVHFCDKEPETDNSDKMDSKGLLWGHGFSPWLLGHIAVDLWQHNECWELVMMGACHRGGCSSHSSQKAEGGRDGGREPYSHTIFKDTPPKLYRLSSQSVLEGSLSPNSRKPSTHMRDISYLNYSM